MPVMRRTERVGLLCILVVVQVLSFVYAWNTFNEIGSILQDIKTEYKALIFRTDGIIIDYGPDPPFAPVLVLFLVIISLAVILLIDEIKSQSGEAKH